MIEKSIATVVLYFLSLVSLIDTVMEQVFGIVLSFTMSSEMELTKTAVTVSCSIISTYFLYVINRKKINAYFTEVFTFRKNKRKP